MQHMASLRKRKTDTIGYDRVQSAKEYFKGQILPFELPFGGKIVKTDGGVIR